MKHNHEKIIRLLGDCIAQCGYDDVMADTKKQLKEVLVSVQAVASRRTKREEQHQQWVELAKKKQKLWWEMVKRNAVNPPPELPELPN